MQATIFFDIDGTLIDVKHAQNKAGETLYSYYGFSQKTNLKSFLEKWNSLTESIYNLYTNGQCTYFEQRQMRIRELFRYYKMPLLQSETEIYNRYLSTFEKNWLCYLDVVPCLQQLAGYNLAVITNGDEQQQTAKLQKNGLMPFFSDIVCANSYGCAKPSLQLFNIAMERSNTTAELCVNVGDTLDTDIKPLGKLGIIGVLIDRKAKGIKKEEGYYRIGSLEYLPILLQQLFEE